MVPMHPSVPVTPVVDAASASSEKVAGYRIHRLLARGGMAHVYLAERESDGGTCVLKLLPISEHDGGHLVQRLINEAALLSQITNPCVAQILDHGFTEWHAYIAMEYLPGGDLRTLLDAPVTPDRAVEMLIQLAGALDAVHGAGIVHCDVKPDNVLRRADGTLAIVDFGIARKLGMDLSRSGPGNLVGTASYIAPERLSGGIADHRSDLYALGVLFHEMLTGRKPYVSGDPVKLLQMHRDAPLPQLPGDVAWAQKLLERLLAKHPDDRFQSAAELIEAVLDVVSALQHHTVATDAVATA